MAESKSTTENPAEAEKPKSTRSEPIRGAWAIVDDLDQVVGAESSEIKAFRFAMPLRARIGLWVYGMSREAFLAGLPPVVKP